MPVVIAIDPSVSSTGAAIFRDGALAAAFHVGLNPGNPLGMARLVERRVDDFFRYVHLERDSAQVVTEQGQIYEHGKKAPDEDVLTLHAAAYAIVGRLDLPYTAYTASQWKKQLKKDMVIERVQKRLSLDELRAVDLPPAAAARTDVWEAIGIGLVHIRRWMP